MEERDPAAAPRDPATVQAEIERVQRRLAQTVDEIADRTKPANVARRGWQRVRGAGSHLAEEARALVAGGGAVRLDSHVVEPPEGSVLVQGDGEVVSTYTSRARLSPEVLILGAGVGLALTVGLIAMVRRSRRGR
ncbi:DUF3618 domain-containing protein [Streptomonospora nanhaiensis]|uniref:DUF3618 domain-containing protein n=1 Tax=Streptomonospora nanhaiensis TaxID=1323731 RepID=A0A853BQL7_9ACTN|nr:DUF3618 domain-containing protein [Streptomonospora nanhaiensis]MBV2362661.1 DUF3618 domain-containing protein [Streptomonospora nanhaiensis]MBX9387296.1 DUF3618 domain-containing protein [Streptomonospora nanhaiensis]NYI97989.1 hypothetical protein [Streptomonospora nanhaiensis]